MDKAEKFNAIFTSVINTYDGPWDPCSPEVEDHDSKNDKLPANSELVWDFLLHLDAHKSMGSNGVHPGVLKYPSDVIMRPLSIFLNGLENLEKFQ